MGHTNSTTNYNLPQFVTTDKPAWLTDINGAFSAIDSGIHTAQTDATTAKNTADSAQSDATAAGTAASGADSKASGAIASIANAFDTTATYAVGDLVMYNSLLYICSTAVNTPGAWTGSTNWTRKTIEDLMPTDAGSLPLGSSTPSGSTAAAIADKANKTATAVTILAVTNVSSILNSGTNRIGNLVILNHDFRLTANVAAGDRILTVQLSANYPSTAQYACAIMGSSGKIFKIDLNNDGAIKAGIAMTADEYYLVGCYRTN